MGLDDDRSTLNVDETRDDEASVCNSAAFVFSIARRSRTHRQIARADKYATCG